jgi:pimeloyl-ACP methyl ester carboxylesterase
LPARRARLPTDLARNDRAGRLREHRLGDGWRAPFVAANGLDAKPPSPLVDATVVLVGGFAAPAPTLYFLSRWLRTLGYRTVRACHRSGLDCSERSYEALLATVGDVVRASRRPTWLLGHSRGGQVARVLATRRPDLVSGLIALGTPFTPGLAPLNGYTRARIRALGLAGSAGVPSIVSIGCLKGGCCSQFWLDLTEPWPAGVSFTAIYGSHDRVVRWRDAVDPAARTLVVPGTHLSLLASRASYVAISKALAAGVSVQHECGVA